MGEGNDLGTDADVEWYGEVAECGEDEIRRDSTVIGDEILAEEEDD